MSLGDHKFFFDYELTLASLPRKWGERFREQAITFEGFDSGSERTLAAWIRHASRTNPSRCSNTVAGGSGERGSNAWVTYLRDGDSLPNGRVIPGELVEGH